MSTGGSYYIAGARLRSKPWCFECTASPLCIRAIRLRDEAIGLKVGTMRVREVRDTDPRSWFTGSPGLALIVEPPPCSSAATLQREPIGECAFPTAPHSGALVRNAYPIKHNGIAATVFGFVHRVVSI